MYAMGGGWAIIARIWTLLVCVRKSRREPSGASQKLSCMSVAGWSGGKPSFVKLFSSSSTSGPSCTAKPRLPRTSTISSRTIEMGCAWPTGPGARPGSVRSKGAALRPAARFSRASAFRRSSNAASISCLSVLTLSPTALRLSAGTAPIPFKMAVSSPFLPRILAFSSRSACSVAAAAKRSR